MTNDAKQWRGGKKTASITMLVLNVHGVRNYE